MELILKKGLGWEFNSSKQMASSFANSSGIVGHEDLSLSIFSKHDDAYVLPPDLDVLDSLNEPDVKASTCAYSPIFL